MSNYATLKRNGNRRRFCWASQLNRNPRLDSAIERIRAAFFSAQLVVCLPDGETLAVEVSETGKRLAISGRFGRLTIPPRLFWGLIELARKVDLIK